MCLLDVKKDLIENVHYKRLGANNKKTSIFFAPWFVRQFHRYLWAICMMRKFFGIFFKNFFKLFSLFACLDEIDFAALYIKYYLNFSGKIFS